MVIFFVVRLPSGVVSPGPRNVRLVLRAPTVSPSQGRPIPIDTRVTLGKTMPVELTLLQTASVAALLGLKPQTLRKWRLQGRGPRYVRLGGPTGRVVYRRCDVDAWLDARTFDSTAAETASRA